MRNNKKKGFTLVELLVVIAILAILSTVAVVGYTSYIESTAVRVDKDLANQLNHKLAYMKADYQGEYFDIEVNEDNIREITQVILKEGGLDKLEPKSADYGYNFYFDLANGEYVVIQDDSAVSGVPLMHYLVHAENDPESASFAASYTKEGNYVLVSTGGSDLADIINGFYKLTSETDYETLYSQLETFISAGNTYAAKIKNYLDNSVVVTNNGNYRATAETPAYVIFADGLTTIDTVTKVRANGWNVLTLELDEEYYLTTDTQLGIPDSVTCITGDALNLANGGKLIFNKISAEIAQIGQKGVAFTNEGTIIVAKDGDFKVKLDGNGNETGVIVNVSTGAEVELSFENPATGFLPNVVDVAGKVYNFTDNNKIPSAYVALDQGSFKLYGKFNSVDGLPVTDTELIWTLVSGSEYVTLEDDTLTFVETDFSGLTDAIQLSAQLASGEGEVKQLNLYVVRIDSISFKLGTETLSNNGDLTNLVINKNGFNLVADITYTYSDVVEAGHINPTPTFDLDYACQHETHSVECCGHIHSEEECGMNWDNCVHSSVVHNATSECLDCTHDHYADDDFTNDCNHVHTDDCYGKCAHGNNGDHEHNPDCLKNCTHDCATSSRCTLICTESTGTGCAHLDPNYTGHDVDCCIEHVHKDKVCSNCEHYGHPKTPTNAYGDTYEGCDMWKQVFGSYYACYHYCEDCANDTYDTHHECTEPDPSVHVHSADCCKHVKNDDHTLFSGAQDNCMSNSTHEHSYENGCYECGHEHSDSWDCFDSCTHGTNHTDTCRQLDPNKCDHYDGGAHKTGANCCKHQCYYNSAEDTCLVCTHSCLTSDECGKCDHVCDENGADCIHSTQTPVFTNNDDGTWTVTGRGQCNGTLTITIDNYNKTLEYDIAIYNSFDLVAKNDLSHLGNGNAINVEDLFEGDIPTDAKIYIFGYAGGSLDAETGAQIGDYMDLSNRVLLANAEDKIAYGDQVTFWVDRNVIEYDHENNTWGTIQFYGTRTQAIYIAAVIEGELNEDKSGLTAGKRISEDIVVNVVEANNIKNYGELVSNSGLNYVLLGDIRIPNNSIASDTFAMTGTTLYGNCYTFDVTNGSRVGWGIISLVNAHIQDLRVIGAVYPQVTVAGDEEWGSNAVHAVGSSSITNCYIANCRAPLSAGSEDRYDDKITVQDTVLFGGRYANIDLRDGEIIFKGNVYTINQAHTSETTVAEDTKHVIGLGIVVWLEAGTDTKITGLNNVVQYNFVSESYKDDTPTLEIQGVSLKSSEMMNEIFNNDQYEGFRFGTEPNRFINTSIVSPSLIDGAAEDLDSIIGDHPRLDDGDRTGFNGGATGNDYYQYDKYVYAGIVDFHIYGILNSKGQDLLDKSEDAEYFFSPWTQTVGEETFDAYDFVNGSIIPETGSRYYFSYSTTQGE